METRIYRVIDANLNRYKEGLRVVEDIQRYVFDNKELSLRLKKLRHLGNLEIQKEAIKFRDSNHDVLKPTLEIELKRENLDSIITANLKRAQESARVLEECFKLSDAKISEIFKDARYELYDVEKQI
ncbi:thiamine-phosphate pyrophosphorylase [Campylobacter blaseri]|uniref:Thiamine-phosphate pyrophosphorylase n=1 Tax=Campylobacter blaseri TaxID=2042961 RepID=A0A2P8R4C8_9BACT|nr:thiamine-phosphate pyrophosphorylase [Campylobacter blaseri]PSM53313.1 thiamine-phosphate pyrophosphorylase [Campylobacter blaseri]PSM54779.1 thiamine-phosphate pyrophosphorylase [Campylobacter blaseri]